MAPLSPLNRTLLAAVKHDDLAGVEALVRAGADVDALEAHLGRSPIAAALERGLALSALGLLQSGARLESRSPGEPGPLYALAALPSPPEHALAFFELLLAKGALPDARGLDGESALHACARLGRADFAEALLATGASVDPRDDRGRTPLMLALQWAPDAATPALLVHAGADLSARDLEGRDARAIALARGEAAVAEAIRIAAETEAAALAPHRPR